MMYRRFLLSTSAGAALLLTACESTQPELDCDEFFTTIAETRGDTVVLTSGLRYIETQLGNGATAVSCRGASISARGELLNETEFQPIIGINFIPGLVGPNQLIEGMDQGVVGMRVGGKRRLIIPPALGYGGQDVTRNGEVVIPANSTIVFDVEVLAVQE
jgi:peptidylprolyl isomerase